MDTKINDFDLVALAKFVFDTAVKTHFRSPGYDSYKCAQPIVPLGNAGVNFFATYMWRDTFPLTGL